jgi:hypothetical protein
LSSGYEIEVAGVEGLLDEEIPSQRAVVEVVLGLTGESGLVAVLDSSSWRAEAAGEEGDELRRLTITMPV